MSEFQIEQIATPAPDIIALIERHFDLMRSQSPEESCHVMSAEALFASGAAFYALRDKTGRALGIGALKALAPTHGELKSMHTVAESRGLGVGSALVDHLLGAAREMGFDRVSLETGSEPAFGAARRLYERHGFAYCPPFGDYKSDPLSVFMTRAV